MEDFGFCLQGKACKVTTGFEQAWAKILTHHPVGSLGLLLDAVLTAGLTNRNSLQDKVSSRLDLEVAPTGRSALSQDSIANLGTGTACRPNWGGQSSSRVFLPNPHQEASADHGSTATSDSTQGGAGVGHFSR